MKNKNMKRVLFFLMLNMPFIQAAHAQKAMSISEAEINGMSMNHLDSLYQSALQSDSTKAVFGTRQNEFQQAYVKMLNDLGGFLNKNNFKWEKPVKCFNRIYFSPDGKIDYFLFKFKQGDLTIEKEKIFSKLVTNFAKDYQFSAKAERQFAQCSPVKYSD